jgi:hypothetical protein
MSIFVDIFKDIFKGIRAIVKWFAPENTGQYKPEHIDVWDEVDGVRGDLLLGRQLARRHRKHSKEQAEEKMNKEKGDGEEGKSD